MEDRQKILIVDDNELNILVLQKSLETEVDAEIISANSGHDALALFKHNNFALAILDVQMPEMNGFELAKKIKTHEETLPIIFISAYYIEKPDIMRGYSTGAVDYITKPFDPIILISKVKFFLNFDKQKTELKRYKEHLDELIITRTNELKESEDRFKAITTSAQDAIITINHKGHVTYWNKSAEKMFGYKTDEILGKNLHDLIAPQRFLAAHKKAFKKFIKTGEGAVIGKTIELSGKKKNNSEFPIEVSFSAVKIKNQWNAISIIRDITKRKQAQQSLIESKNEALLLAKKAQEGERTKSAFLANMSHEIRTPMNGVIGMIDILLNTELKPEQQSYAIMAKESGKQLMTVINDILDISKIEAGKLKIVTNDFNLYQTLEQISDIMIFRVENKELEIINKIDSNVPQYLHGDQGRIRQIIINLCGNAVKFTKKGEIVVHTSLQKENNDEIIIRFEVSDTGIGIPEDKIDSLFNAFTQIDNSYTRETSGTGLGLDISKRLTEMMGGEIGVESVKGKGSTFWFTIKLKKPLEKKEFIIKQNIRNENILVVDDNATNRQWLSQLLNSWSCEFDTASNGEFVIQKLHHAKEHGTPFTIILIDMIMRGISGETLAKNIKNDPKLQDIHIIMMTSLTKLDDLFHLKKIGITDFITKPIKQSYLYDSLVNILTDGESDHKKEKQKSSTKEVAKKNIKILVAEDNPTNRIVIYTLLKNKGYDVTTVNDGKEAVEAMTKEYYDIIFMDIQMPVMSGIEATHRIREKDSKALNPKAPIIAFTANAMEGDRETYEKEGMDDYVSKPVNKHEIEAILEKWTVSK